MSRDTTLLHIYDWRRGNDGPYYLRCPCTVDDGITLAEDALKDRRRGFMRAVVKDVRADTRRRWSCRSQSASRFRLANVRVTKLSSALSDGAKYLKSGALAAVQLNRFPSNANP
jgi:hypothetical protein